MESECVIIESTKEDINISGKANEQFSQKADGGNSIELELYSSDDSWDKIEDDLDAKGDNVEKAYMCSICPMTFRYADTLKRHEDFHNKKFHCLDCNRSFSTQWHLHRHKESHAGRVTLTLSEIPKDIESSSDVPVETRIPSGVEPYTCSECDLSFTVLSHLRNHRKTHIGNKPHKCPICSKTFRRQGDLKRHRKNHVGNEPHTCSQCSKTFERKAHLDRHLRIHTGEKPFECKTCGKRFNRKYNLKVHYSKVHNEKEPSAEPVSSDATDDSDDW